ncbi:MAG: methyltransferase domain-containing protein [Actinomycetota bacterium]|nr:methyltransferase domain-containing protein [Actinomycetota bacterium]
MYTKSPSEAVVPARQRLVWQVLTQSLDSVTDGSSAPSVLDCGGGTGSLAVPLAQVGATVTVLDISVDALATLHRRSVEAGVADRVTPVQGDIEALREVVAAESFDLVLVHGTLEDVDDVQATFAEVVATVRPGGLLSVLVNNPVASVLARALAGELVEALDELHELDSSSAHPAGPEVVRQLCLQAGLIVEQTQGVGVFTELVPGSALEAPGAAEALVALEVHGAARVPFVDIASRVHTLARRPK